jgi:hypothetical protein
MAQMCVGQPCTPTNVVWKGGLSEIFQIEINNEGVPTGRFCNSRRLTA